MNQEALCFKLRGRIEEEATKLTVKDLEDIGYEFKVLLRYEPPGSCGNCGW